MHIVITEIPSNVKKITIDIDDSKIDIKSEPTVEIADIVNTERVEQIDKAIDSDFSTRPQKEIPEEMNGEF